MNKEIKMITLNKIKACLYRIYEAEDEDCPNRRVIEANNRALNHYLKGYSIDQVNDIAICVEFFRDNCAVELEKIGWKIIREK